MSINLKGIEIVFVAAYKCKSAYVWKYDEKPVEDKINSRKEWKKGTNEWKKKNAQPNNGKNITFRVFVFEMLTKQPNWAIDKWGNQKLNPKFSVHIRSIGRLSSFIHSIHYSFSKNSTQFIIIVVLRMVYSSPFHVGPRVYFTLVGRFHANIGCQMIDVILYVLGTKLFHLSNFVLPQIDNYWVRCVWHQ